jgi:hypothetical protein
MTHQIRRFGVIQTAKVFGVLYALVGLLIAPFLALSAFIGPAIGLTPLVLALLAPVFYGVLGFIMMAIAAALYNVVAGWIGGIDVELTNTATAS